MNPIYFAQQYYPMMGGYYGWDASWIGAILMIVFWVLIIIVIISLIRYLRGDHHYRRHYRESEKTPLEILKERYAKGEITKDDFERMKKDLA